MYEKLFKRIANLKQEHAQHRKQQLLETQHASDWEKICRPVASFEEGTLLYLTEHTKTEDQHWLAKGTSPVSPFPKKDYFLPVLEWTMKHEVTAILKSREMMTSWLSCGYITWMCLTLPGIMWLIQTDKEKKARQLINYCRILYRHSDEFIRLKVPKIADNKRALKWANGSHVLGIPCGVNQVRLYHPYGYLMDEAAFLPEAEECYNVVRPVAKKILMVSSDEMGWFHNMTNGVRGAW